MSRIHEWDQRPTRTNDQRRIKPKEWTALMNRELFSPGPNRPIAALKSAASLDPTIMASAGPRSKG